MRQRDNDTWYLNLIGHRDCIDTFKLALKIYLNYYEPFKQREQQRVHLNESRKVYHEEFGAVIEKPVKTRGGFGGPNSGMRMTRGGSRGGVAPGMVSRGGRK